MLEFPYSEIDFNQATNQVVTTALGLIELYKLHPTIAAASPHHCSPRPASAPPSAPSIPKSKSNQTSEKEGQPLLPALETEPVNITPLLHGLDLRFRDDLDPSTWGFTMSLGQKNIVAINTALTPEQTRYTLAHEVMHLAQAHPNQLGLACQSGRGEYNRLELEALIGAAYLLIPQSLAVWLASLASPLGARDARAIQEVAKRLVAPIDLLLVRRKLYLRTGF